MNPHLKSFLDFLEKHPDLRPAQALRAYLQVPFLLTAERFNPETGEYEEIKDTYYD
jgi:hypothetical protein